MLHRRPLLVLLLALAVIAIGRAGEVTVARDALGHWELRRDGQPVAVRGLGGPGVNLDLAVAIGATSIRTWGAEDLDKLVDGKRLADRAHELHLGVLAGLWVEHERQGMNYDDQALCEAQRNRIRAAVRRHRGEPAILAWGLGNEMEGPDSPTGHERVWREIEVLAGIVKAEDPHHPIVTTIAGASREKLEAVRRFCPSVDVIGLNLYGGAPMAAVQLDLAGWDRPFMLTEYGPPGPWEAVPTPWGAPIEPDTLAKVASYLTAYRTATSDPRGRCIGTFAFVWGQKQEATATWFGMFLPTGEKTPMVDIMCYAFTGRWPANCSPKSLPLRPSFAYDRVRPGAVFEAEVSASDPEHDRLSYEWKVVSESVDRRIGGDAEARPLEHPECVVHPDGPRVVIRLPEKSGAYRLFVYVRDGHGGGCSENTPFYVEAQTPPPIHP